MAELATDMGTASFPLDPLSADEVRRVVGVLRRDRDATLGHPRVAGLRTVLMAAPERRLYRRLGFGGLIRPERWMERPSPAR